MMAGPWEDDAETLNSSAPTKDNSPPAKQSMPWEDDYDHHETHEPSKGGIGKWLAQEYTGAARGVREALPFAKDISAGTKYLTGLTGITQPHESFAAAKRAVEAEQKRAAAETPLAYGAGFVGGALAPVGPAGMALKAEQQLATKLAPKLGELGSKAASTAATGAGLGALMGAGEGTTLGERAESALSGAGLGAGVGAAAPVIGRGISKAAPFVTKKALGALEETLPGVVGGAEKSASKRLSSALEQDRLRSKDILSPEEIEAAQKRGQPIMGIDVGGPALRGEARRALNLSENAETTLAEPMRKRYLGQQERYINYLKGVAGDDLDAAGMAEQMREKAHSINNPAYELAYKKAGSNPIYTPELHALAQSPAIKKSLPSAVEKAQNKAAIDPTKKVPEAYTLEFWDNVKRSLDDKISALDRSGEYDESRGIKAVRSKLLEHLDKQVPEFKKARSGAAELFGEDNAFDAGLQFLGKTKALNASEAKSAFGKLKPQEKDIFQQGMLQDLMQRIKNPGTGRDATRIFDSPEMKEKLGLVLGPEKAAELEAFTRVEDIMALGHTALQGNSTTSKQLARMGALGKGARGAAGAIAGSLMLGPGIGTGLGIGAETALEHLSSVLGKEQASEIAKKLVSNDPKQIQEAAQAISSNPKAMDKLRNVSRSLAMLTTAKGASTPPKQDFSIAASDREERASGGSVNKKDYPAKRLTRMERAVKRAQDAIALETKPILNEPDHVVARALEIAKDK